MPSRDLIVNMIGRTGQLMGPMNSASAQMTQIGGTLTRTLTPAAAALGAGMALAGREFNSGVDALRVGTGATGDALSEMTDQMKSVSTNSSLARIGVGRVGEIMADVNTATGATGDTLEALTTQFGQLERMGIGADVNTVARAFGDWGVETENQTAQLDAFFVAAQASGATVDELAGAVTQFGAPLRNLGFGLEESTALIASFQQNGVNLETVMGGLRQGIGTMARAGEDVPETFRRVVDEIKNTEDASEATRLAIELFGQRAGPDLADSIRNGQFAVEDMQSLIADSGETIGEAAESTTRLTDKMAAFKNKLVGTLGPFGEFGAVAGGALASLGPLMMGMGQMGPALSKLKSGFVKLHAVMMANPWVLIAAAIVALGVVIFIHREKILKALIAAWEFIRDIGVAVWDSIKAFFEEWWPLILAIMTGGVSAVVMLIIDKWDEIKQAGEDVWNAIKDFFKEWWPLILGIMTGGIATVIMLIVDNWDQIKSKTSDMIDAVVTFFRNLPGNIVSALSSFVSDVLGKFHDVEFAIAAWVVDLVSSILGWGADIGRAFINGIVNGIEFVAGSLISAVRTVAGNMLQALKDGVNVFIGLWNNLSFSTPGWDPPGPGPTLPSFTIHTPNIPYLGTGGIVTGPMLAMLGENGPEAVIPLNRANGLGHEVTVNVYPSPGMNERQLAELTAAAVRKGMM